MNLLRLSVGPRYAALGRFPPKYSQSGIQIRSLAFWDTLTGRNKHKLQNLSKGAELSEAEVETDNRRVDTSTMMKVMQRQSDLEEELGVSFKRVVPIVRSRAAELGASAFSSLADSKAAGEFFFERDREGKMIINMINGEPQGIIPLVGPANVGKTTIIYHYLKGKPVASIHMGNQGTINTVDQFVRLLQSLFAKWDSTSVALFERFKKYFGGTKVFGFEVPTGKTDLDYQDFSRLLSHVTNMLRRLRTLNPHEFPVILVDGHAQLKQLMNTEDGRTTLKGFFDWALYITNEKLSHIVIVLSDNGLIDRWLKHEFELAAHFRTIVIDDLTTDEARTFLRRCIRNGRTIRQAAGYDEPDYNAVVAVLGGRVYHLKMFAQDYLMGIPTDEILQPFIETSRREIMDALNPETFPPTPSKGPVLWSRVQLYSVLRDIAAAPEGLVPYRTIRDCYFDSNRDLNSLVHYELLSYRPPHAVSTMLHEPQYDMALISAASPAHLHTIKLMFQNKKLPTPLISVLVRAGGEEAPFREVDLYVPMVKELQENVASVFGKKQTDIESIKILPDREIYRDLDFLAITLREKMEVKFKAGTGDVEHIPTPQKVTRARKAGTASFTNRRGEVSTRNDPEI